MSNLDEKSITINGSRYYPDKYGIKKEENSWIFILYTPAGVNWKVRFNSEQEIQNILNKNKWLQPKDSEENSTSKEICTYNDHGSQNYDDGCSSSNAALVSSIVMSTIF